MKALYRFVAPIRLKAKKITSKDIVITYCLRSINIGKDLNLLADIDFENALK
jgi:hypothetical protein